MWFQTGNPWPLIAWLNALCREMQAQTLRVGAEPQA